MPVMWISISRNVQVIGENDFLIFLFKVYILINCYLHYFIRCSFDRFHKHLNSRPINYTIPEWLGHNLSDNQFSTPFVCPISNIGNNNSKFYYFYYLSIIVGQDQRSCSIVGHSDFSATFQCGPFKLFKFASLVTKIWTWREPKYSCTVVSIYPFVDFFRRELNYS